jgi:hypothetical protein
MIKTSLEQRVENDKNAFSCKKCFKRWRLKNFFKPQSREHFARKILQKSMEIHQSEEINAHFWKVRRVTRHFFF